MKENIEGMLSVLHKSRSQLLLIYGLSLSMVLFTACSSTKAVQTNAAVASEETSSGIVSASSNTSSVTSSDLVSHSAPSVSSAVLVSGKPSTGSNSTSHQAPVSQKPSTGTTKPASAAPKPASTKPASTKPASTKPASTAPAPKPVSTAPSTGSISAKYNGATYGATSQSQYDEILSYAKAVTSSSTYKNNYAGDERYKDQFVSACGVEYSEKSAMAVAIIGCFQNSGSAGSHGNAYTSYTQSSSNCADDAKAIQAALNVNGISCKLVWGKDASGTSHMWTSVYLDGAWHQWGRAMFSNGTPKGYTVRGSGYNY